MTTSIRASLARLALSCAAVNDIRYYLAGIRVEPRQAGGAYIVGCDGHRMIAIIDEKATCDAAVILKPDATIRKRLPKVGGVGDVEKSTIELTKFDDKPALLFRDANGEPAHLQIRDATLEGNFPIWQKVLPNFEVLQRGVRSGFRLEYVTSILDSLNRIRGYSPEVHLFQREGEDDSSITCRIVGHDNVVIVVMPHRNSDNGDAWRNKMGIQFAV